jgi:hypothetical protein
MRLLTLTLLLCSFLIIEKAHSQNLVSEGMAVTSSSVDRAFDGRYAVDGMDTMQVLSGNPKKPSIGDVRFSKTMGGQYQYLQIDLGSSFKITKVEIHTKGIERVYTRIDNNNLIIAASNDASFKGIYNPAECAQNGIATQSLNTYGPVGITPISQNISGRYVRIWDRDIGGVWATEIKVYGEVTGSAITDAIKTGDSQAVNEMILDLRSQGRPIDQDEVLRSAIDSKNPNVISTILSHNPMVDRSVMEYAMQNYNSSVVEQLLSSGDAELSSTMISQAIQKRDESVIRKMAAENSGVFSSSHLTEALNSGQINIAETIMERANIVPGSDAMLSAVKSGNMLLVNDMVNKYGGMPTAEMLNESIRQNNQTITNLMLTRVQPNSESYVLAAQKNDPELYTSLTDLKPISDNRSINIAIDKDNLNILKSGLSNGGNTNDAMNYAIQKNKPEIVEYLANRSDSDPNIALEYAVTQPSSNLFRNLINKGADPNVGLKKAIEKNKDDMAIIALETNQTNPTPYLVGAIKNNKDVLAKKIVEYGGDPNAGMEEAINANKTDVVEHFINHNASVSNPEFMKVAAKQNPTITRILVERGANPDDGMSAAAGHNQLSTVKFLLEYGANADKGMVGASLGGHRNIVSELLNSGADANKGIEAAIQGRHESTVQLLLENGADATVPKYVGIAAAYNDVGIMEALLDNGANPENGISYAVQNNADKALLSLLEYGADGNKDEYMLLAAQRSCDRIVPIIAQQGVDMERVQPDGRNYLHISIGADNCLHTVIALAAAGAPINGKDNYGNTPLHTAAMDGKENIDIIEALAAAGADVNAKNNAGETPRKAAKGGKTRRALKKLGGEKN